MSGAVMAASPRGGAGRPGGLRAAGLRVQAMSGLGEISSVWVSEGGLELPSYRAHRTSPAGIETLSEQAFRRCGRLLSRVRIHPHSPAPVSRPVSRRPFAMPANSGPPHALTRRDGPGQPTPRRSAPCAPSSPTRIRSADKTLGDVAELNARRTAAAAVLADYKAALASAPLASPPGREWMLRLASVLEDLLAVLGGPDDGEDDEDDEDQDDEDDFEPYCSTCGAWIGILLGHGDGWLHYRARALWPARSNCTTGHAPVVAWRPVDRAPASPGRGKHQWRLTRARTAATDQVGEWPTGTPAPVESARSTCSQPGTRPGRALPGTRCSAARRRRRVLQPPGRGTCAWSAKRPAVSSADDGHRGEYADDRHDHGRSTMPRTPRRLGQDPRPAGRVRLAARRPAVRA